jgi:hypothetical protein
MGRFAMKWRKWLLPKGEREYQIQQNDLGEFRVQCRWGRWQDWETMGRLDGRSQWHAFVTEDIQEADKFIAVHQKEQEDRRKRNTWRGPC